MESFCRINSILKQSSSTFQEFETTIKAQSISQQTYLNLFLTTVAIQKSQSQQFEKYLNLLLNFKSFTGKKSADIRYIGYKDRRTIMMHVCQYGNQKSVQILLKMNQLDLKIQDPEGRNAIYYALYNNNEETSNQIINIILDYFPDLINCTLINKNTLAHQAIKLCRPINLQFLLKKGVVINVNISSFQIILNELLKNISGKKKEIQKILSILLKNKLIYIDQNYLIKVNYKKGNNQSNNEDIQNDNQSDKLSLTTWNQYTKVSDDLSSRFDIQSVIPSQKIDFSQIDDLEIVHYDSCSQDLTSESQDENQIEQDVQDSKQTQNINYQKLSLQIFQFGNQQIKKHQQAYMVFQPFLKIVQKIGRRNGLGIQLFGSFATGLWTNTSDIDISLVPLGNDYINFQIALERVFQYLKNRKQQFSIKDIYLNRSNINSINIELGAKFDYLKCDIAVFHKHHQNKHYVAYISEALINYPQIKHIFFVYKQLLKQFKLQNGMAGGVKTYTLFLMILNLVKNIPNASLGEIFCQIATYYGFYYEYSLDLTTAKVNTQQNQILNYPQIRFNMIDPLNPKNNVGGKQTKVHQLRTLFRSIYYLMEQQKKGPFLSSIFNLYQIF